MSYRKKFNETIDNILGKLGINADSQTSKIYEKEEMRGQVTQLIENNSDKPKQQVKVEADQFLNRLDHIVDEAKHTGRMEERMKGQDSDAVYNMLIFIMGANLVTVGMLAWVHFV